MFVRNKKGIYKRGFDLKDTALWKRSYVGGYVYPNLSGEEDANGGYVAVKGDGTIVCYFIYDRVGFMDYLIAHTKMERPSTSRHDYAKIFKTHNGQYMMKLNLQVRFMQ